jgi:hypothetical protein
MGVQRGRGRAALNRRRFIGATGAAGAAAFVAACGGGDDKPASTPAAQSTSGAGTGAATQAAAQPAKPTGTINVVQGVDANTMDYMFQNATPESTIRNHVYDTLL